MGEQCAGSCWCSQPRWSHCLLLRSPHSRPRRILCRRPRQRPLPTRYRRNRARLSRGSNCHPRLRCRRSRRRSQCILPSLRLITTNTSIYVPHAFITGAPLRVITIHSGIIEGPIRDIRLSIGAGLSATTTGCGIRSAQRQSDCIITRCGSITCDMTAG